ncbi:uncharacterized protein LOC106456888 [Limulus polyphemus]|uniref:Uncharacterized protein LOC106456888 n=1 Tax=Limulus polyphemus TaxID=6850 RepID=A0ABM1S430_LIMPO|nr:uncharacterized protein LOC106456888 [Limulus polyphemus]
MQVEKNGWWMIPVTTMESEVSCVGNCRESCCRNERGLENGQLAISVTGHCTKSEKEENIYRDSLSLPSLQRSTSLSLVETKSRSPPPPKPPRRKYSGKSLIDSDSESSEILRKLTHQYNHQKDSVLENVKPENSDHYRKTKDSRWSTDEFYYSLPATLSQETICSRTNISPSLEKNRNSCNTPLFKDSFHLSPSSTNHSPMSVYRTPPEYPMTSNYCTSGPSSLQHRIDPLWYPSRRNGQAFKTSNCGTLKNKENENFRVNSIQEPFHRRHNSDPLVPWDQTQSRKSCSKRSRSFVDSHLQNVPHVTHRGLTKGRQLLWVQQDPVILLEEIRMLEEINDKLWQKLQKAQAEIEILRKTRGEPQPQVNHHGPGFAELLAGIYYAQKERDKSVTSRLRLANQERDQAIQQLQQAVQVLGNRHLPDTDSNDDDDDESVDVDLNKVLDSLETTRSPARLLHHQEALLANLHKAKSSRQHQMTKELNMLLQEKNAAIEKTKLLEQEILLWRRNSSSWKEDSEEWESKLKETMQQATEEYDSPVTKYEELETLCRDQLYLSTHADDKQDVEATFKQSDLEPEVEKLREALNYESSARQNAEENCQRLENLVSVLKKKVNGLSVGLPV